MTVKEYVENVTAFEFGICGYLSGMLDVKLRSKNGKRTISIEPMLEFEEDYKKGERVLTEEEWTALFTKLFEECRVMEYAEEFRIKDLIMDGESWNMVIEFRDGSVKESRGNNAYPDTWDALIEAIDSVAKK